MFKQEDREPDRRENKHIDRSILLLQHFCIHMETVRGWLAGRALLLLSFYARLALMYMLAAHLGALGSTYLSQVLFAAFWSERRNLLTPSQGRLPGFSPLSLCFCLPLDLEIGNKSSGTAGLALRQGLRHQIFSWSTSMARQ